MKKRICIGIPCYKEINTKFAQSLLFLVEMNKRDYDFHFTLREGPYIIENRRMIVQDAKDAQCDYVLFLDSDMVFGEDTLTKLIAHDKDIVGVDYSLKTLPLQSTVKFEGVMPKELFKCKGFGFGFVLVKTEVFNKIEEPYFQFHYGDNGFIEVGEDIHFCRQAIKAGLDVWCDPQIQIKHEGSYLY